MALSQTDQGPSAASVTPSKLISHFPSQFCHLGTEAPTTGLASRGLCKVEVRQRVPRAHPTPNIP